MECTREKRYLPYNKWDADTLLHLQAQAANSPYQLHYHLHPISGLVNDPNGFSYFNGAYHLFYQSYPFGAVHGLKSWVHFKSQDLVNWTNLGLAVEPDTMADSHGAYSGSAREIDGRLFLMYTGNHRDENWVRTPYQIGAWMTKDGKVSDKTILFKNPDHITEHFRDPQILKQNDTYYAILGAQDKAEKHGHIDIWKSQDLKNWEELGFLDMGTEPMGYMIECPNIVRVDGKVVVIFCPQGLDKKIADYDNVYPDMYIIADDIDFENHKLINPGKLHNLDKGFDVYATQAFNAPDGHAYEVSWVGLPDTTYPTDDENWANCLSQVKELVIKDDKLIQKPVKAMRALRQDEEQVSDPIISEKAGQQYELKLKIAQGQTGNLHLAANEDLTNSLQIKFDTQNGKLVLDRAQAGQAVAVDHGTSRETSLVANKDLELDIFVDHSLIEVFVNGGEEVLTGRYFADQANPKIAFEQNTAYTGQLWQMKTIL
ncbi:sucrose-6-phosphate hydrolase [Lactobacillus kefiranofaciens]|uniref:Sucrose-6-phosphate hydrolase n=1 Tax=Lactobacillus kefiranofaciens TaxID=267818 RepID=A0AAX3UGQ6_9LACO|nr:sucrose-6-phosphate hydrolase [Lactobacillus kefiranofaciens]AEG39788.1 Beta-fructofuranosidase [Lactobacillus kefiranofaciens subsp. kefiranofaciens]KRL30274.1 beta-fructofuranosidase [Lactobacillus kefiranofaciens subsp. kefirgranum DSM 10550 = JCM 8572]KRM22964.1 beta-fructofuranosidase [Lactobacillus kefiranofaciens subsp. kefiranofaciens DSM 5016 = JCM 6985]MCJ2171547.1 sucrose-6-phosphate hydrolase [Lactobacillus kefiranofaciens]MCP9330456.1 sucrose-6-phosphate hydrolase [Lactobacillu